MMSGFDISILSQALDRYTATNETEKTVVHFVTTDFLNAVFDEPDEMSDHSDEDTETKIERLVAKI